MEKYRLILMIIILAAIPVIILVIRQNRKDRKNLFKKMPGDYPEPPLVKSEFDKEIK